MLRIINTCANLPLVSREHVFAGVRHQTEERLHEQILKWRTEPELLWVCVCMAHTPYGHHM